MLLLICYLPCQQHPNHLLCHMLCLSLNLILSERRKRVGHIDYRIVRHPPYRGCRLRCGHEMIGADGRGWDASAIEMNAVVHTARAAGASIAHPNNDQVAGPGELVDHFGVGRFGSRWFAITHDIGEAMLRMQDGGDCV